MVGLYRSKKAEIEDDPSLPWTTVCESHAGIISHATKAQAESAMKCPEDWCSVCSEDNNV